MTEYYLAGLIDKNLEANLNIVSLHNSFPQFFNDDIKIAAFYGSFEKCIWNGGRENDINMKYFINPEDIISKLNDLGISVRFTFTNPFIREEHLNDKFGNYLMSITNNGMNGAIVASDILFKYLKSKYPNFKYIYSTTNCNLNIEDYNDEKYDIYVLDYRLNKTDLSKLKHKDRIEILVDDCCPICEYRKQHFENIGRYNLGEKVNIDCVNPNNIFNHDNPKIFHESLLRTLVTSLTCEEIEKYKQMGFNKFKLTGRTQGRRFLYESFLYYLVKPEYRYIIREELNKIAGIKLYDDK